LDLEKWIPVIVSVIGVFAGSIPFILAAVSNESTGPPTIDLVKQVSDIPIIDWFVKSNHALFTFSNIGQSPATNVSLIIDSPKKIINVPKISCISKLILQNPNSSVLENNIPVSMNRDSIQIDIPKMINGKASLTEIKVSLDGEQGANDYRAFIIFDQGSDIGRLSGFLLLESPAHLILYGILYFFYIFL